MLYAPTVSTDSLLDQLIEASRIGDLVSVNKLLENPEVVARAGELRGDPSTETSALLVAIENRHFEIVNSLLELPSVIEHVADGYNQALHIAAEHGYIEIVIRLLQINDVLQNVSIGSNRILYFASLNGHSDVVDYLLEIPTISENPVIDNDNALNIAAWNGHLGVVNSLVRTKSFSNYVSIRGYETLLNAVYNNQLPIIQRLLEIQEVRDVVNVKDNEALIFSAAIGSVDIVNYLLDLPEVYKSLSHNATQICSAIKLILRRIDIIDEAFDKDLSSKIEAINKLLRINSKYNELILAGLNSSETNKIEFCKSISLKLYETLEPLHKMQGQKREIAHTTLFTSLFDNIKAYFYTSTSESCRSASGCFDDIHETDTTICLNRKRDIRTDDQVTDTKYQRSLASSGASSSSASSSSSSSSSCSSDSFAASSAPYSAQDSNHKEQSTKRQRRGRSLS